MTQEPASLPAPVANPSGMITEPVDSALPTKRARMADTFLMAFAAGLVVLTASFVARNSDVWQHLSVGRLIAGGQYDFATDPLGYATSDASWVNHFWLTDWLWYQIFQRLGGSALVGLKAICLLLAIIVALPKGRPNQPRWLSAFWVALAVVAFFSFRRRRIQMLDRDPEALFENREILFGPAADRIAEAVRLGEVEGKSAEKKAGKQAGVPGD